MNTWFYIGTYTAGESKGIYWGTLDTETGTFTLGEETFFTENPSYLCFDSRGDHLYCVNEVAEVGEDKTGAVTALARDKRTGGLRLLNRQSTLGKQPCYLSLDAEGRYVLAANYSGGNVCVLPILADGSLGEASGSARHEGRGSNRERQEAPHPHSIVANEKNFVFVPDLGIDKIMIYKLDGAGGSLTPASPKFSPSTPGAGPRHLVFSPDGRYAYAANELSSTVAIYRHDAVGGTLEKIGTETTLPGDFAGENTCADLHVHPSGRFLYVSNRGHDSLACFQITDGGAGLKLSGHTPSGGNSPRSFAIDPSGEYLVVVNQLSHTVVPFRIRQETGELERVGEILQIPSPTCVKFVGG